VFHYGADRIDVPIKPGSGVDALYAPRRTVLDPILVDAARDAGAEVRFGVAVTDLGRDGNGRVTGIVGRDERGSRLVVGARITIGADGMGSTVSRLAGAPTDRVAANAAAFIYGYWDGLPGRDYELFYQPGVAAGFFPTNRGQTCVFAGTSPQRYRLESRLGVASAYTRLLDQAAPGVLDADAGAPERLRVFAGRRPGFLRRASGPGWALVGDAGYFKDPITATASPTPSATPSSWVVQSSPPPAGRLPRRWRSPPTRPLGTASRNGCSPSPTPSPRSPGISTRLRSVGCCCN